MRFAVLMMTGVLVFAAPAFAQPTTPAAEAEAAAPTPEAAPAETAPAPAAEEDPIVCREIQNTGSRMRSQRTRQCQPRSRWEREEAGTRREYDRANAGQPMQAPTGGRGM